MRSVAARRRSPIVALALLLAALVAVGMGYSAVNNATSAKAAVASQSEVEHGKQLYQEGCSSCHGMQAQGTANGPSLIGVGAAAVDFQVGSGRMPLAKPGAQAVAGPTQYTEEQTAALAAYVASLAPGPAIPTAEMVDFADADVAAGGELFRVNCAQCHQAAGQGAPLTQGKFAPNLMQAEPQEIYEAMITGPQSMPVFSNQTIPVENKKEIIAFINHLQNAPSPGGMAIGELGPVTEGLFLWAAVFAALIGLAVWIGIKAR